jgi:hypothetical protein
MAYWLVEVAARFTGLVTLPAGFPAARKVAAPPTGSSAGQEPALILSSAGWTSRTPAREARDQQSRL